MGYGFQWQGLGEALMNQVPEQVNTIQRQKLAAQEVANRKAADEAQFGLQQQQFQSQEKAGRRKELEDYFSRIPVGQAPRPETFQEAQTQGLDLSPFVDPISGKFKVAYMPEYQRASLESERRGQDIQAGQLNRQEARDQQYFLSQIRGSYAQAVRSAIDEYEADMGSLRGVNPALDPTVNSRKAAAQTKLDRRIRMARDESLAWLKNTPGVSPEQFSALEADLTSLEKTATAPAATGGWGSELAKAIASGALR